MFFFYILMKKQLYELILSISFFFPEKDKGYHATETGHIDLDFYVELKLKKESHILRLLTL